MLIGETFNKSEILSVISSFQFPYRRVDSSDEKFLGIDVPAISLCGWCGFGSIMCYIYIYIRYDRFCIHWH